MFHKRLFTIILTVLAAAVSVPADNRTATAFATAKKMFESGKTAEALLRANHIDDMFGSKRLSHKDSTLLLEVRSLKGACYSRLGNHAGALREYKSAAGIARLTGNRKRLGELYNNIFSIYYSRHEYTSAGELLDMSLAIFNETGDSVGIRNIYNNKGLLAMELGNDEEALDNMAQALSYTAANDKPGKASLYINIGEVYYRRQDYRRAEQMLTNAVGLQTDGHKSMPRMQALLNLALVEARLGKNGTVRNILKSIRQDLGSMSPAARENSYRQLAEIHFVMKDSLAGLHYMLRYEALGDSLYNDESKAQLQRLLVEYDAERLRNSNETLRRNVESRNKTIFFSIFAALVILATLILQVRRMRSDRRKNALINAQKEQLLQYEKAEHERRQREMSLEIDHRNRQLTSYSMDLVSVNEFHRKVEEALQEIRAQLEADEKSNAARGLADISNSLRHYSSKQVSEDFRVYFERVHPGFIQNLSAKHPNLSKNDLRLCTYLYLGMSTKEIATLTSREVRSIESSRNRLRKKLGMEAGEDIGRYLKAFAY